MKARMKPDNRALYGIKPEVDPSNNQITAMWLLEAIDRISTVFGCTGFKTILSHKLAI
jgi:hypothetical protein